MVLSLELRIELFAIGSLIFSFFVIGCTSSSKEPATISIRWEKDRATGMIIPQELLNSAPQDSVENLLHVYLLQDKASSPIFGEGIIKKEQVIFEPLIPFTRGLSYEVRLRDHTLGQFKVPLADAKGAPEIISVYPNKDTLPHNLLKMYISFSKPMQAGKALEHIF